MNHRKRFVIKLRDARFRLAVAVARCAIIICILVTLPGSSAFAESHGGQSSGAVTDFVAFWAAARLLLTGGDPFSPAAVLELQKSVGLQASEPLLMWSPPWTLSLLLPIGATEYVVGRFCWLLLQIFLILYSAQILWAIYDQSSRRSYLPWIAALTLIPSWFVLLLGQLSPIVLLGLVGFLWYLQKCKWVLAGVATSLISTKPHLAYLFWIGLLLWVIHERRWTLAIGAIAAISILAAVPAVINPAVYLQFIEMYRNPGQATPLELPVPSLGSFLKLAFPYKNAPVQFLPPIAGVLWFVWYWTRRKDSWNWAEQMPLILLVSLSTSAYAWTYDYLILLPAVIHGLVMTRSEVIYKNPAVIFYILVNCLYLGLKFVVISDYYYFWLAPAFLLTYWNTKATTRRASTAGSGNSHRERI